jgi:hypothetical protein
MGYRTITRYSGAVAAAVLLSPGAVVHRPVHEVQIVASRFMFEPAVIELTAGEPCASRPPIEGHRARVYGANAEHRRASRQSGAEPTVVEFVAPPPGRFEIACSEFCGSGHGHMKTALISIDPL